MKIYLTKNIEDVSGYKYYSTLHYIEPGILPKRIANKIDHVENFNDYRYVDEIGRKAWGYIEFAEPISKLIIDNYADGFVLADERYFYKVTVIMHKDTHEKEVLEIETVIDTVKPEDTKTTIDQYSYQVEKYFDTYEKKKKFIDTMNKHR